MDVKAVDMLLEQVFVVEAGAGAEDLPPEEPPKPRFSVPSSQPQPKSVKKFVPKRVPPLDPTGRPKDPNPVPRTDPDDRIGRHSMHDLFPAGSVANRDDLMNFLIDLKNEKDPVRRNALQREFDARKAEFESRLAQFVDSLLG